MASTTGVEENFEGQGGLQLFARSWRPDKPKAAVIVQHGFHAHSGQYAGLAQRLNEIDIAVYAPDMRGHGKSGGERFWVDHFDDYLGDLGHYVDRVRAQEGSTVPIFLFGHSYGGLIVDNYALLHQDRLSGLVSVSALIEPPIPASLLSLVKLVGHILPHAPIIELKDADFSRDPDMVAAMAKDPLVIHRAGPAHTLSEGAIGWERIHADAGKLKIPLLVQQGTADKTLHPSGSTFFFENAGSSDKTLKLYEGAYHDLYHDLVRDQVTADLTAWLQSHIR